MSRKDISKFKDLYDCIEDFEIINSEKCIGIILLGDEKAIRRILL